MTSPTSTSPTSTARIPAAPITGFYGAIVKKFAGRMFGRVPESLGVMWHHLPALKASMAYGQKLQKWDECDETLKTYAHMAVASVVGCSWCLDFNYFMTRDKGLDEDKAREVPRWRDSDVFSPLERQVMAYAEAASLTPPTVTDEMVAPLLAALGPAGLVELTSVIGFANLTTRGNVALGIESEGFASACGMKPLAEPGPSAVVGSRA
ncbi:MAG TPA: carboxymuconolactone decarboxylase family protein [Nocardioides sp.]|nr:carboxymuconolactone decarboxylase family protein [Nocardioides sp.]